VSIARDSATELHDNYSSYSPQDVDGAEPKSRKYSKKNKKNRKPASESILAPLSKLLISVLVPGNCLETGSKTIDVSSPIHLYIVPLWRHVSYKISRANRGDSRPETKPELDSVLAFCHERGGSAGGSV
jgi:hypothetical protein